MSCPKHLPSTPDGRYFVHGRRLWRCSDPPLPEAERARVVRELMDARPAVGAAVRNDNPEAERETRARVHNAKVAPGERGPTWWGDDEDHNRKVPENTPYAEWWRRLGADGCAGGE